MSHTGRVLVTGLRARPDDGRELLAVEMEGGTGIWLLPDAEVPPDETPVAWGWGWASWQRPDGSTCRQKRIGFKYDANRRWL